MEPITQNQSGDVWLSSPGGASSRNRASRTGGEVCYPRLPYSLKCNIQFAETILRWLFVYNIVLLPTARNAQSAVTRRRLRVTSVDIVGNRCHSIITLIPYINEFQRESRHVTVGISECTLACLRPGQFTIQLRPKIPYGCSRLSHWLRHSEKRNVTVWRPSVCPSAYSS